MVVTRVQVNIEIESRTKPKNLNNCIMYMRPVTPVSSAYVHHPIHTQNTFCRYCRMSPVLEFLEKTNFDVWSKRNEVDINGCEL